ncbi:preprotein translocase subunit Sec61beta [Candidatus Bathyarchaeota archaeon]|nr:preprotein translocase subunit Sec61beta [Candidatus Bathyarchaeota archaeon]
MMSRRKRRRERRAPMPATGAGLLRFFEEDTPGIRVRPEVVLILSVVLIIVCIVISRWAI